MELGGLEQEDRRGDSGSSVESDLLGRDTATDTRENTPIEPAVLAATTRSAPPFYWFSAFTRGRRKTAEDGFYAALSVAMPDRVDLLERVEKNAGRPLNRVEMLEYAKAENDAYAAYFAFRAGACR